MGLAIAEIGFNCLIGGNIRVSWNVPAGASSSAVAGYFVLWFFFLLTLNPLKEGLFFRAYPIEQFNNHPHAIVWVLPFVSLIFAGVHHVIEPFRISAFLSRFSVALLLAYAYYRWRSIWLVVGIHNGTNFVSFLLGAHWKSGGLFALNYESPSPGVVIAVDPSVKLIGLALIHRAWRRGKLHKKS
jgi:membrane protease YdiL (CAAX protease family)